MVELIDLVCVCYVDFCLLDECLVLVGLIDLVLCCYGWLFGG